MTGRLEGKTAIVTGAAGVIGFATAKRLAEEGANVVLSDIEAKADDLTAKAGEIEAAGGSASAFAADITDYPQVEALFRYAVDTYGRLDVVHANAGVLCRTSSKDTVGVQAEQWKQALDVNITGTWHTLQAAAAYFREAGHGGSIVITSSVAGVRGGLNNSAYSATKHAVLGLQKTAAHELGRLGVRVNAVLPTGVKTPMFVRPARVVQARPDLKNPTVEDAEKVWKHTNLLGVPWVEAVDVANAVLFLASDEARYITGIQLIIDAGQTQINPFSVIERWLSDESAAGDE